jgi:hypothetical protein
MRALLVLAATAGVAHAQPANDPQFLTVKVADLPSFVAGPQHAQVRWFTVEGCGTLKNLHPLRRLPADVEVHLGQSDCLTVDKVDGIERAKVVISYAIHRDITGFGEASRLRRLHLLNGPLPLAALGNIAIPSLDYLDLNVLKNKPAEIARFLKSPLLGQLRQFSIHLDHPPPLPKLPRLRGLDVGFMLANPNTVDLSFLDNTPNLVNLSLGGAEDADLTPILSLSSLETLDVAGLCRIDPTPLGALPRLRRLVVSLLVPDNQKPVRKGLDVDRSNPYAMCSPP